MSAFKRIRYTFMDKLRQESEDVYVIRYYDVSVTLEELLKVLQEYKSRYGKRWCPPNQ